jgi:hypothetical protein
VVAAGIGAAHRCSLVAGARGGRLTRKPSRRPYLDTLGSGHGTWSSIRPWWLVVIRCRPPGRGRQPSREGTGIGHRPPGQCMPTEAVTICGSSDRSVGH